MASWIQEASILSSNVKLNGGSDQEFNQLLKIVQNSCKTETDYKFLTDSELLVQILEQYRNENVLGFSVLSSLIGKAASLPKTNEHVGLAFLMRIIPELDKGDDLYRKCRRLFIRTGPNLSIGGMGNLEFSMLFDDIMNEIHTGLSACFDVDSKFPDLSSLTSYVSFLERTPNEFSNDRHVHHKYESLLSLVDNVLSGSSFNIRVSMYIGLLQLLARLENVLFGGEERVAEVIKQRAQEMVCLAVASIEAKNLSEHDGIWLQEKDLLLPLFNSLIIKLESVYRPVNEQKFTPISLQTYHHTLQTITHISKNVPHGETTFENLLKDHMEEHDVMHKMMAIILDTKFCPDETLLCLDRLMPKADPELKNLLALSIVPRITAGKSFEIEIDRDAILEEDSVKLITNASCGDLRRELFVRFKGEEGIGIGATREWLYLVAEKMMDPKCIFFKRDTNDKCMLLPTLEPRDGLEFYTFFGRIMGLALLHHVQLGITFDPLLVLMLAEVEVTLEDIKKSDLLLYRSMKLYVNDYAGSLPTGQNMEEAQVLIRKYSEDLVNEIIIQNIDKKVANIKDGLDCIFSTPLRRRTFFQTIDPSHLDMVIRGDQEELSVEDWKNHTEYDRNDIHIGSIWEIIKGFSAEEKRDLLFFWTSIRFLGPGGFNNLERPLNIKKTEVSSYPRAFTCSYTLQIPPAPYEELKNLLRTSIQVHYTFGLK